ncbi:c-type cytochrome [Pleionea sediminis]|uniref:c-type cytochrome n=1 Tax=Pleionea sediminis TaxID=2569479 RepID=UPI001FE5CEFA|nr:cytochrome c [Pleionea sediminis]
MKSIRTKKTSFLSKYLVDDNFFTGRWQNVFFVFCFSIFSAPMLQAGDIEKGKAKSMMCASCHGKDGVGISDDYPNLAGQKETYLVAQMKAFRDGDRKNMIMMPMAKPLSDDDIENLAAYYSSLPAKK